MDVVQDDFTDDLGDNEETADAARARGAVYVSWTTFRNTVIDELMNGLPNVIDKSIFPGQAGGVQTQLMSALRFLGLIDEAGRPTDDLKALTVLDENGRKQAMARILRARYADIFALDVERVTMGQVDELMTSSYNLSGETRSKAIRFFIAAAKFAGIPLSRHLANAPVPRKKTAPKRQPVQDATPAAPAAKATPPPVVETVTQVASTGTARAIQLESGGSLTITASLDVFSLSPNDREFVFGLIDRLAEYEKSRRS